MKNWTDYWEALSKEERTHLIDSAAESISEQKRGRILFSDLLGALEDQTAGTTKTGMPKVYRQRSAEDLRKALRRYRERLFGTNTRAWTFATQAYFRAHFLGPFCAFLDAFNVPHDKYGTRTTTDGISPPSPEDARIRIRQLVSDCGADRIRSIALALQANNWEHWSFLEDCADIFVAHEAASPLESTAAGASDSANGNVTADLDVRTTSQVEIAELVSALEAKITSTLVHLDNVRLQLSDGTKPSDPGISSALEEISSDFKQIGGMLGVDQLSVAGFHHALHSQTQTEQICDSLRGFRQLTHRREPTFPALALVHDACDRAVDAAKAADGDVSKLQEIRHPFDALQRAIDQWLPIRFVANHAIG
jgi:hypothetical protein